MIFEVNGIRFSYRSVETLKGDTFSLNERDLLCLLGPNGVGKTTLLKCINRILVPTEGTVMLDGEDVYAFSRRDAAQNLGYVPQRGDVARMTVFDSVLLGRKPHITWDAGPRDIALTSRIIRVMGIEDLAMKYVDEISGGEYQIVQIARAVAQQPKIILLDEPTSNLDLANQHNVLKTLRKIVKGNDMGVVMTLHDLNLALRYSDKFVMMKGGSVYAAGGPEIITPESVKAVYGLDAYVEEVRGFTTVVPY